MKLVTVWESQMRYWGYLNGGRLDLCSGRGHIYYAHESRAAVASPGGPPIKRQAIERDGMYFLLKEPYYGDVNEIPPAGTDLLNIIVFTADYGDDTSERMDFPGILTV